MTISFPPRNYPPFVWHAPSLIFFFHFSIDTSSQSGGRNGADDDDAETKKNEVLFFQSWIEYKERFVWQHEESEIIGKLPFVFLYTSCLESYERDYDRRNLMGLQTIPNEILLHLEPFFIFAGASRTFGPQWTTSSRSQRVVEYQA